MFACGYCGSTRITIEVDTVDGEIVVRIICTNCKNFQEFACVDYSN